MKEEIERGGKEEGERNRKTAEEEKIYQVAMWAKDTFTTQTNQRRLHKSYILKIHLDLF